MTRTIIRRTTVFIAAAIVGLGLGIAVPASATGPAGGVILNGATVPTAHVGATGDFYLDTRTDVLFGPKTAKKSWGKGTSLIGARGVSGTAGDAGAPGAVGAAGPAGANGVSGYTIIKTRTAINSGTTVETVTCPSGDVVLNGGVIPSATVERLTRVLSYPTTSGDGWVTTIRATAPPTKSQGTPVTWYAVCVEATP